MADWSVYAEPFLQLTWTRWPGGMSSIAHSLIMLTGMQTLHLAGNDMGPAGDQKSLEGTLPDTAKQAGHCGA